jgi:hypothetical protein
VFPQHHDFKFCASYKIADQLRSVVFDGYCDEPLEVASNFDEQLLKPTKNSILHDYITHFIVGYFDFYINGAAHDDFCGDEIREWCEEYSLDIKTPKQYFEEAGIEYDEDEADLYEYNTEYLRDVATERLTPLIQIEVFNLLFTDRCFLIEFNKAIAADVSQYKKAQFPEVLSKDGVVKRATYWPAWLKRALLCREKGLCAICKTDLSSIYHTTGKTAIDHMVPLNLGGINDASNLQMLCEKCNLEKLGDQIVTTNLHPTFW